MNNQHCHPHVALYYPCSQCDQQSRLSQKLSGLAMSQGDDQRYRGAVDCRRAEENFVRNFTFPLCVFAETKMFCQCKYVRINAESTLSDTRCF